MYSLLYKKSVEKDLRKIPKNIRIAITDKILSLAKDPQPDGCTKLKGATNLFRIRHTNYRVIYSIDGKQLVVLIIKVAHRREVYQNL